MSIRHGKVNSALDARVSPVVRQRKNWATNGVRWAIQQIEERERQGVKLSVFEEFRWMACAFILGARGSKSGKLPLSDAERATNELIDTGSVGELGVRLWVRVVDGLSDGGGWYVGYEEEADEDAPRVVAP